MALEPQFPCLREEGRNPNASQTCLRRASDVPQAHPKRILPQTSFGRVAGLRRSPDRIPSTRWGKVQATSGKVRRGSAQSGLCDRSRSHGRRGRGEAEPGRRGAGSGRGPTKRKGGKRDPAEVRQRAQASSAISSRKSHKPSSPRKPASPVSPQPHKPSSLKSRKLESPARPAIPQAPAIPQPPQPTQLSQVLQALGEIFLRILKFWGRNTHR